MSAEEFDDDFDPSDEVAVAERLLAIKQIYGRSGLAELKIGASLRMEDTGEVLEARPLSSASPEERASLRYRCAFCGPGRSWATEREMRDAHRDVHGVAQRRFGSKKLGEMLGADLRGENHVWFRHSAEHRAIFSETEWKDDGPQQ